MKRFQEYFARSCYAFTIVLVLISLINLCLDAEASMSVGMILSIFCMVAAVCLLMCFTDKIPVKNLWLDSLIRFSDIVIVVLPGGWLLGWFTRPLDFALVMVVNVITYVVIYGVTMFKIKTDADNLNREILSRKEAALRKKEEKDGDDC